ncbi:MAG: hypothetical protein IBJ10_01585 [Phycisphaerales bacterium]|nr:hypothetical protein [Phycisphaerales bacterium]
MSGPGFGELEAWRDRLRRRGEIWLARAGPVSSPPGAGRFSADPLFLAWRRAGGAEPAPENPAPDLALWRALLDGAWPIDVDPRAGRAPIAPRAAYRTIEAWTEADLACIHALWWLGRTRGRPELIARSLDAADWHIEHIQPDNATNRPWAIHVFLDLWRARDVLEGRLHAETLLHNADVAAGSKVEGPGAVIAHIAADGADALDAMLNDGAGV